MTPPAPGPDPSSEAPGATADVRAPAPEGLHARPASRVVDVARRFTAETVLVAPEGRARAKDLLDLLALALPGGTPVRVEGRGPDASAAVAALERLFADLGRG